MKVTAKARKKVASLGGIMPNIKGHSSNKRAILSGAIHNILLYGAPV